MFYIRLVRHVPALLLLLGLLPSCAGLDTKTIEDAIFKSQPLDEKTVAAGLKEALKVGTACSVDATSAVDGFLGFLTGTTLRESVKNGSAH